MSQRPRVATVVSAGDWETNFVNMATASSMVRLVDRLESARPLSGVEVILVSADTPWITPTTIRMWQQDGASVIGMHTRGDKPAQRLLAHCDEIRETSTDAQELVHLARLIGARLPNKPVGYGIWFVTGPPGAPGRTEVATALALAMARSTATVLLDGDLRNPSVSLRLGLAPEPSLVTMTHFEPAPGHQLGRLQVIPGGVGTQRIPRARLEGLSQEALAATGSVVVDTPGWGSESQLPPQADALFVCDASPVGVIRAAVALSRWNGPAPTILLNRVNDLDMVPSVRAATGLEPDVLLADCPEIRSASIRCAPSPDQLIETLRRWLDRHATNANGLRGTFPNGTRAAS